MSTMLLVPLEDVVVFPNMNVTLTSVDVGSEERVLLVPRHEHDYASVGTVAEVTDRVRLPGGGRAVALTGLHRGLAGAAESDARGQAARGGRGATGRRDRRRPHARARARVPRDRRGDPRAARRRRPDLGLRPLDHRARRTRRHRRLLARLQLRAEGARARDDRHQRAARARDRAPARAARGDAGAPPHPRRRRGGRGEAAARVHPPQADGVDPEGARRGRRVGRRRSAGRSSRRRSCPRPCASRPSASSAGSSARARARPRRR